MATRNTIDEAELQQIEEFLASLPEEMHDKDLNVLQKVVQVLTSPQRMKIIRGMEGQLQQIEHVLSKIIDDSYQGLLASIQSYSHIVGRVQNNKIQVKSLKQQLQQSNQLLNQNVSHMGAKWQLASQYGEMCQLLDCIAWLKTVPSLLEVYIPDVSRTMRDVQQQLGSPLNTTNSTHISQTLSSVKQENNKSYLHASLLLLSAAFILNSDSPQIQEGELPILRSTKRTINTTCSNESPLSKIPAVVPLRSYLLNIHEKFHEVITEDLRSLIYNETEPQSKLLDPFYKSNNKNFQTEWPQLHEILKQESTNEKTSEFHIERVTEDLGRDYSSEPALFMLILVESLISLGKEDEAAAFIASKAIIEFRDVMSESLAFVKTIFKEDLKLQRHSRSGSFYTATCTTQNVSKRENDTTSEYFTKYPKCIPSPHLISSATPHHHSPALAVLLNIVSRRFLTVLQKQMYLAQIFEHRNIPEESVQVIVGTNQISRIYKYSIEATGEGKSLIFRPPEMWELMQTEIIGLLRAQIHGTSHETKETKQKTSDSLDDYSGTLFHFAESAAYTETSKLQMSDSEDSFFDATPYNLIPIYLPLVRFNSTIVSLLQEEGNTSWTLKEFLDQAISTKLFETLQKDSMTKLSDCLSQPRAWTSPTIQQASLPLQSNKAMLKCGEGILQLLRELHLDIQAVPVLSISLTTLNNEILSHFSEACNEKINSVLQQTRTEKRLAKPALSELLLSHILWKKGPGLRSRSFHRRSGSLGRNTALKLMREDPEKEKGTPWCSKELKLEKDIRKTPPTMKELVWDVHKFSLLGNISNTLELLVRELQVITRETDFLVREKTQDLLFASLECKTTAKAKPILAVYDKVKQKCLNALRVELRHHCYFFLDKITSVSYVLEEPPELPDSFIDELISDLCSIESRLSLLLAPAKQEFLFGDIAQLIKELMIRGLSVISGINPNGIMKMRKNVFSMLQSLPSSIVLSREHYFDSIRIYYDLLQLTPEELFQFAQNAKSVTSKDSYNKADYLVLASSLCSWQHELQKKGNFDEIAIKQLQAQISALYK